MRFRAKFLVLLLVLGVAPLGLMAFFGQGATIHLGRTLAREGADLVTAIVRNELLQSARDYALVLDRTSIAVDLGMTVLARETERALAGASPDLPDAAVPDIPVFLSAAPADTAGPAARDREVLSGLAPLTTGLVRLFASTHPRLTVALRSGPILVAPAPDGIPADYDPRARGWYAAAAAAGNGQTVWNDPVVEPLSGRAVVTVSRALRRPDGDLLGVVALEAGLTSFLEENEVLSQWSGDIRAFAVTLVDDPAATGRKVVVWARRDYEKKADAWTGAIDFEELTSPDAAAFADFAARMEREASGTADMPLDDAPSIWAFARLMEDAYVVLVLPKKVALALSGQTEREVMDVTRGLLVNTAALSAGMIVVAVLAALWATRTVTRPMTAMIQAWRALAGGDYRARVDIRTGDERDDLARAFNETVPKLAERLRMQKSLEVAQEVQRTLLPAAAPDIPGLDMAGVYLSCDETGGDSYDYLLVERDGGRRLDVLVGDVTGHGLGSALLMTSARAYLRAAAESPGPLARRAAMANRLLCRDVADSGRFMTLFWIEYDPDTGALDYVRAGHDPAALLDPERPEVVELTAPGLPLGIVPDYPYQERTAALDRPGQVLAMGTDGIWEARDPSGEMFGKARFYAALRQSAHLPAKDMVAAVMEALSTFKGAKAPDDDVTLVILKKTA